MLNAGTTLGPYKILAPLGAGGMGEVYRASDTRLGRDVAIKVIPADLARDRERIKRFEQEARAAGALNHPNVCAVFDIGTYEGSPFVVMELLEGDSLRGRLQQGPIAVRRAIDWAAQAAHGLAAAHEKGIVHRDLKPENLFLTEDGRVKVLDFGLAKLTRPEVLAPAGEEPVTVAATQAGAILGTMGYMAPEQVRGESADHRADIFALGSILYELLTGTRAFSGSTFVETSYRILNEDPPLLSASRREMPGALQGIVQRCLEKSPNQRFQNLEDLAFALESVNASAVRTTPVTAAEAAEVAGEATSRPEWRRFGMLALVVALPAALLTGLWLGRGTRPEGAVGRAPTVKFQIELPVGLRLSVDTEPCLAISPDGGMIVVAGEMNGEQQLYRRLRSQVAFTAIPGTAGARSPFFSPNGEWIGYGAGGSLKKLSVRDGREEIICEAARITGACWTESDSIIFSPNPISSLAIVSAAGGESRRITSTEGALAFTGHALPVAVNDGAQILFVVVSSWSYSKPRIDIFDRRSGQVHTLLENASSPVLSADGELLFTRDGILMATRFDRRRLKVLADPIPVAHEVTAGSFTALCRARDGTVCYVADIGEHTLNRDRLVWVDQLGEVEPLGLPVAAYCMPTISPDGSKLAVTIFEREDFDLWVYDLERGTMGRLSPGGNNHVAIWKQDMSEVFFTSDRGGAHNLYSQRLDRREPARQLTSSPNHQDPVACTPDGRNLAYWDNSRETGSDLRLLPLAGGDSQPLVATASNESHAAFSPDGRYLAYASDESGILQVYLEPFGGLGARMQISVDGGAEPIWHPDGSRLYFRSTDGAQLMVVTIEAYNPLRFSAPRVLVQGGYRTHSSGVPNFALHPRNDRFLLIEAGTDSQRRGIEVIMNWRLERSD